MISFKFSGFAAGFGFVLSFLMGIMSGSSMPNLLVKPLIFAIVFFGLSALIYILVGRFLPEVFDAVDSASREGFNVTGTNVNISEGDFFHGAAPDSAPRTGHVPVLSAVPAINAALADEADGSVGDMSNFDKISSGGGASPSSSPVQRSGASGFDAGGFEPVSFEPKSSQSEGLDQSEKGGYNTDGGLDALSPGFDFAAVGKKAPEPEPVKVKEEVPQPEVVMPTDSFSAMFDGIKGLAADTGGADILPDLDSLAKAFSSDSGGGGDDDDGGDYSGSSEGKKSKSGKGQAMDKEYNPKDMAEGIRTLLKKEG